MGNKHLASTFFWPPHGHLSGSAGSKVVFCLRWESPYPRRQPQPFCNLHFSRLLLSITDSVEKILKSRVHGSSLKKTQNTPQESQVSRRWWCRFRATVHVPAFLAASLCGRQLPALGWWSCNEDLGCLSCICYWACSSAVLVMTSISNIFKVIWALHCYSLSALEGKIGKID